VQCDTGAGSGRKSFACAGCGPGRPEGICGGDVGTSLSDLGIPYERFVFELDNEPRSADTIRRMLHAVELGASICIWTVDSSLKDVNDMIKSGIPRKELLETISHNIYKGTKAIMKIKQWKKV
jgi:hypothetical protein